MKAQVIEFSRRKKGSPNAFLPNGFRKPKNADVRSREYLTPDEVNDLMRAAKRVGRHGHRDATLILLSFRHGLRLSELVSLRWDQVELKAGRLHVTRSKNGSPSVHPLRGPEIRSGAPNTTRTCDLPLRRRTLYPTELPGRLKNQQVT